MRERPLSPHLQIYRFRYSMTTSILTRFTGIALSIGLLLLTWWLMSAASGAPSYASALTVLGSPLAKLVYAGLIAAFVYHFVNGIRHLVWDAGYLLERAQSQRSAWFVAIASIVLSAILIFALLGRGGAA